MRRRSLALIVLAGPGAALGGCDKIDVLETDARSGREVVIRVTSGRCIDHLEIGTPEMDNTILWKIERQEGASKPCPREFVFPKAPRGYTASVSADRLPAGSYVLSGMAQDYAVTGHFDISAR